MHTHTHPAKAGQKSGDTWFPITNELAAVCIGECLTNPDLSPQDKEKVRETLSSFEDCNIVYVQNTANELNVVLPCFPEFDKGISRALQDGQLEQISGGEVGLTLGFFFGGVGISIASAVGATGIVAGGAMGGAAIAIGVATVVGVVSAGIAVIGGVAAGIGVGIAAGLGAFDSGGSDVSIGFASGG